MNINEASTSGNAEVIDELLKELRMDTESLAFVSKIKFLAGDQLSIARLRSVSACRAGNEGGAAALRWALFTPGLFHYKMAATHGFMLAHLGQPNHLLTNPATLTAHNTILERKPIVATSLPPFRTCRDLIFVSLYARVLHCLLLVGQATSLQEYASGLSWETLTTHATAVIEQFTDNRIVHRLRQECADDGPSHGDMVFENAILFMRDALHLREFCDAIKAGDSGRVLNVLKVWALTFRGNGHSKYAYEILYLVHNLTHVWPPSLAYVLCSVALKVLLKCLQ